jgi:hypothetical protein
MEGGLCKQRANRMWNKSQISKADSESELISNFQR